MTRIKISHEQGFKNKECLEEALAIHYLGSVYTIARVGDKYQLNTSSTARNGNKLEVETSLKKRLSEVVRAILPTYSTLLATKDFSSKGFYLKKEIIGLDEKLLVFEKTNPIGERGKPEQIIIKIRTDYILTLDTRNFTGRKCLDATKQFEDSIGQVIEREMKSESATNNRKLLEISVYR